MILFQKEESGEKTKRKSSHAENKQLFKYRCDFCSDQFPDLKKLNSHRRQHTGEKPFICPVCCKAFRENVSQNYSGSAIPVDRFK